MEKSYGDELGVPRPSEAIAADTTSVAMSNSPDNQHSCETSDSVQPWAENEPQVSSLADQSESATLHNRDSDPQQLPSDNILPEPQQPHQAQKREPQHKRSGEAKRSKTEAPPKVSRVHLPSALAALMEKAGVPTFGQTAASSSNEPTPATTPANTGTPPVPSSSQPAQPRRAYKKRANKPVGNTKPIMRPNTAGSAGRPNSAGRTPQARQGARQQAVAAAYAGAERTPAVDITQLASRPIDGQGAESQQMPFGNATQIEQNFGTP